MPKLNKRAVDAAQATTKRFILWDDQIRGFGLLVLPSGVRSYLFNYRSAQGRERRITIGQHGDLTCEQARKIAAEHRHAVVHGNDPLALRREQRQAITVAELLDAYMASEHFADKAKLTKAADRSSINRHLRPLLGRHFAHLLSEADVRRAFNAIRDGKTGKGGPGAAREAVVRLRIAYGWALSSNLLKGENPCRHIKLPPIGTRDSILENADDYRRLFNALDRMENERRIAQPAADAIRLIALVGCRRGEATGLRWRHVERGRIVIPPLEHKAGKRTGKPRIIVLPTAAQAIVARQPEGGPDDLVFRPAEGRSALALSHAWPRVRAEAGLADKICLHSLRHSTASHLAMAGAEAPEVMAAMGHSQLRTVARYVHFGASAREALAEKAAAVALAGMNAAEPASVTTLKGGRR